MKIEWLKEEGFVFGRLEYACLLRKQAPVERESVKREVVVIDEGGRNS